MTLEIHINGQAPDPTRPFTKVVIRQYLGAPAECEMQLSDPSSADQSLAPGTVITVTAEGTVLFEGFLVERQLSFGGAAGTLRQMHLIARDALHHLRHRWHERTFGDTTAAGLIAALVAGDGITVTGAPGPRWAQVLQHGQDDLALLELVAERAGLTFCLRGRTLHLLSDGALGTPVVLTEGVDLMECTWTESTPSAGVAATGWDTGLTSVAVGVCGRERLNDLALSDPSQARALAGGIARRRASQAAHLSGLVHGTSALQVGGLVQVAGAHLPSAPMRLSRIVHTIESGFWTTAFHSLETERITPSRDHPLRDHPLVTIGQVTAVDDPQGCGRIRVSLPACAGIDGGWLAALAPGGGAGRGLIALPGIGDRVVVLYLDALRSQGMVLGGLWGAAGPADAGLSSGEIRRYTFRTADGRKVVLDDARGELTIADPAGNHLAFSSSGTVLHSVGPLVLEAPGKSVTITGSSIDFTSG